MKSLHVLLQRFADAGLEFVVVGGFAGVLHGSSYVTDDLDICAVMSTETVAKLRATLTDLHPVHRMTPSGYRSWSIRRPASRSPISASRPTQA